MGPCLTMQRGKEWGRWTLGNACLCASRGLSLVAGDAEGRRLRGAKLGARRQEGWAHVPWTAGSLFIVGTGIQSGHRTRHNDDKVRSAF